MVHLVASHLFGTMPLSNPVLSFLFRPSRTNFNEILFEIWRLSFKEMALKINILCKMAAILFQPQCVNSLAPGRFQINFRYVIFKLTSVNGGWGISYKIALRWMPLDLTDDKSTLVLVMTCITWANVDSRSMSPNGITRSQLVKCDIYNGITSS